MRIAVLTCDKYLWAARIAAHLLGKYWSPTLPVDLVGFTHPGWSLPASWRFCSMGRQEDYPVEKWSNAVAQYLKSIDDDLVLLLLEDFWLCRRVDAEAMRLLETYMSFNGRNVARMDVTTDRLYANGAVDVGPWDRLDLIKGHPDSEYQISLQASIWNRGLLLELLAPDEMPWQFETAGCSRLRERPELQVLGTRQGPLRYVIGIRHGEASVDGSWQFPPKRLEASDVEEIVKLGLWKGT